MRIRIPVRRDTLRIGGTLKRAHADATAWIRQNAKGEAG
jgi:hypothetical protein